MDLELAWQVQGRDLVVRVSYLGLHFLNQHNLFNLIKGHFLIGCSGRSTTGESGQAFNTGVAFILAVCLWASHLTSLTLKIESPHLNLVGVVGIHTNPTLFPRQT